MTSTKTTDKLKNALRESVLFLLLIALIILFSLLTDKFFTQVNLTNIIVQNVHVAVCSTAVMLLMVSGSIDLSIGYQISTSAVLCTMMITIWGVSVWVSIICGIVLAVLFGAFNGIMSRILKAHPMIITLGTMAIFQGISYLLSQSKTYFNLPYEYLFIGQGRLGPVPVNAIIAFILIVLVGIVLSKTYLGRYVYAVGDNPTAAHLAGINVQRVKLLVFIAAGLMVGISAILLSARNGSADSTTGLGIEFTGITACVLGGCSLKGGVGKLWKVIVAVFVLGVLSNGMQLIGLGVYPQYIAKGVIMLVSIGLNSRAGNTAMTI